MSAATYQGEQPDDYLKDRYQSLMRFLDAIIRMKVTLFGRATVAQKMEQFENVIKL